MTRLLLVVATLAALAFGAAPGAGQGLVRVEGTVTDHVTDRPIPWAEITVRRAGGRAVRTLLADSVGRFHFEVRGLAGVRMRVEAPGYEPGETPVLYFDDKRYLAVEVRLDVDAFLLAPLEVLVWSAVGPSGFLDSFRRRVRTGMGIYLTRADIEARDVSRISELLRTVPGLQVASSGSGLRPGFSFGRSAGMRCYPQLFIDGRLMNAPTRGGPTVRIDDLVSPAAVEGIEIYRGLSTVPAEFLTPEAECGVVAVWTRRGPGS